MKPLFYLHRNVGTLKPNGVFVTFRTQEHFFRKFGGFGFSFDVLHELKNLDCWKIVIVYERKPGDTVLLEATPDLFLTQGILYLDGGDAQRILPLSVLAQEKLKGGY